MVYMTFPSHLTEEEELLMRKYAVLKKKRRLLQSLREAKKQDPKKEEEEEAKLRRAHEEAASATEAAKKLLKSGAIRVASEKKESSGFKRSKRQKDTTDKSLAPPGYEPFTGQDDQTALPPYSPYTSTSPANQPDIASPEPPKSNDSRNRHSSSGRGHGQDSERGTETEGAAQRGTKRGLYDNFVSGTPKTNPEDSDHVPESSGAPEASARSREWGRGSGGRERRARGGQRADARGEDAWPRKGHTVYVSGHGITHELLTRLFNNIGSIVNISMEAEKNCAFVTFDRMESADEAISQMNGSMVGEAQLRVSMARRQPAFAQSNDAASSSWASISANNSSQAPILGNHKDSREAVIYDDPF